MQNGSFNLNESWPSNGFGRFLPRDQLSDISIERGNLVSSHTNDPAVPSNSGNLFDDPSSENLLGNWINDPTPHLTASGNSLDLPSLDLGSAAFDFDNEQVFTTEPNAESSRTRKAQKVSSIKRPFNESESEMITRKREARLQQNRLAASRSRAKKKAEMSHLQKKYDSLHHEVTSLKKLLYKYIEMLQKTYNQNLTLNTTSTNLGRENAIIRACLDEKEEEFIQRKLMREKSRGGDTLAFFASELGESFSKLRDAEECFDKEGFMRPQKRFKSENLHPSFSESKPTSSEHDLIEALRSSEIESSQISQTCAAFEKLIKSVSIPLHSEEESMMKESSILDSPQDFKVSECSSDDEKKHYPKKDLMPTKLKMVTLLFLKAYGGKKPF
eukprot:CAMPEP_0114990088 /NCGR_PEP_ID=MMETSP0216-20121206/10578_1 /TAXON_ID=223996 /ORGANISM="Protocruzia adherens, Strain Boccale" /LENGTH=385 /DNA_ID=CAMNT_0002353177 /DNA_START=133 /DNA_END=1290 /DNA_ORIENTATION=-